jgi:hypothetical protein
MSFQSDYDKYRQGIYDKGAAIVAQYNAATDVTAKQSALAQMINLMNSFDATTKTMEQAVPASGRASAIAYADPRFHDFYDFFQKFIAGWQAEVSALVTSSGGVVSGTTSGQGVPAGCTAGICGPVPIQSQPTTQLVGVASGAPNAQGAYSVVTSGGGGTVANNLPLQSGGLAPSPYSSDLPGASTGAAIPSSTTSATSSGVLQAGLLSGFDFKTFFTGPMGLAIAGLVIVVLLLKNAKG